MILRGKIKNLAECEQLSRLLLLILKPNVYLILQGELGVGKTTLVQFLAKNLGINEKVISPTFNILRRYQIKKNCYLNHFDFFRLNPADNLDFFSELLVDNLNIIEWGEKNPHFWQEKKYLIVNLTKKNNSETRIIVIDIPFLFSPH